MSDTLALDSLEIKNFRAFKQLRIERLSRVNLIVGKNNIGKTSLLEGLKLYADHGSPRIIWQMLRDRDEVASSSLTINSRTGGREIEDEYEPLSELRGLFFGRPDLNLNIEPFSIGSINQSDKSLTVTPAWYSIETDEVGLRRIKQLTLFGDTHPDGAEIGLAIRNNKTEFDMPMSRFYAMARRNEILTLSDDLPVTFVPATGLNRKQTEILWDRVQLTDDESEVINCLKIIADDVERVSVRGEDRERIWIAKSASNKSPVPLKTFGDGMNRLLGLILALVNTKGGLLLIDEIDTGLHYSVLGSVWQIVMRVAKQSNIQVFATTHSWDCIEAFSEVLDSNEGNDAQLISLRSKKNSVGEINAVVYDKHQIGIASKEAIEVR